MYHDVELRRQAVNKAAQGKVQPTELLPSVPSRTLDCDGADFKRLKSLAVKGRPLSVFCLPMISPVGWPATLWFILTNFVDLTYTAFIVALSIAFNDHTTAGHFTSLSVVDMIGSSIYVIDLILGFQLGFVARWDLQSVVVRDGHACAMFYMEHGSFLLDALAAVPFIPQLAFILTGSDNGLLRLLYLLRLVRVLRVVRLLHSLAPGKGGGGPMKVLVALFSTRSLMFLNAFFSLGMLVNLLGCVWWNVAVSEGLENSWVSNLSGKSYDLFEASNPQRWVVSCYFCLTTIVTIGYGDITPVTIKETGLTMIFQIVGVAFFGYLLNVVTNVLAAMGSKARRALEVKEKLQDVEDMMKSLHLPAQVARRIRAHFAFNWSPQEEEDPRYKLFRDLTPQLQHLVLCHQQKRALAELKFFPEGLHEHDSRMAAYILAGASTPVRLRAGELLQRAVAELAEEDDGIDLTRPYCFILDEGEMQAVRPDDEHFIHRRSIGGRVDFSGPALIGLSALFSADVLAAAEGRLHKKLQQGQGGKPAPDGQEGQEKGEGGGDLGEEAGPTDPPVAPRVLALTECHLWLIDCRQVYKGLQESQPVVLLHLLQRLIRSMGSEVGSTITNSGGGGGAGGGSPPGAAQQLAPDQDDTQPGATASPSALNSRFLQRQQHFRNRTVERLQLMQAQLMKAAQELRDRRLSEEGGGGRMGMHWSRHRASQLADKPGDGDNGDEELTSVLALAALKRVSVDSGADFEAADVWLADD